MWTEKVLLSDLRERDCWKVEFFCGETTTKNATKFDLVVLRDIVEERRQTLDPQAEPNDLFNYIGLENIQSVTGDLLNFKPKYGKEIRSRSKVFCAGNILYGRLRPNLNKVYLADEPVSSGICSGEFYVLSCQQNKVLPNFLRAVLASKYVQQYVCRWQTGSALPRLQIHDLLAIKIPLPPLNVQLIYEEFLIRENNHRCRLAAELAELPQRTLDAVVQSLESGEESVMTSPFIHLAG